MKSANTTLFLTLLIILSTIILWNSCNCGRQKEGTTIIKEVVKIDTVIVSDTVSVYVPKPIAYIPEGYVKATSIKEVKPPVPVIQYVDKTDTAYFNYLVRIKDDYFSKVAYQDSIHTPYGPVVSYDTVNQNRISARSYAYNLKIPEKTIERTIAAPRKNLWLIEASAGYRTDTTVQVGAGLMVVFKNKKSLRGSWKIDNRSLQTYEVGFGFPLVLKR